MKLFFIAFLYCVIGLVGCKEKELVNQTKNETPNTARTSEGSIFSNNVLLTKNRDALTVCIEVHSDLQSKVQANELIEMISRQVNKIKDSDNRWKKEGFNNFQVEIKAGCSFSPLLFDEKASHPVYSGKVDSIRNVETPSKELFALVVANHDIIDKHFKTNSIRWVPEQYACAGHDCFEVTKGIYLTIDELSNEQMVYTNLLYGFGVEPVQ